MRTREGQKGATLIELAMVLVTLSALALVAGQGVTNAVHAARKNDALSDLMASLTRARSVAANSELDVVICPSSDGKSCDTGYHWERGWIAFKAPAAGSNRTHGEPILVRQPALARRVHLITSAGRTRIRFQGNGGNAGSNVTFTLCDGRGPRSATAYAMANNGSLRAVPANAASVSAACAEN